MSRNQRNPRPSRSVTSDYGIDIMVAPRRPNKPMTAGVVYDFDGGGYVTASADRILIVKNESNGPKTTDAKRGGNRQASSKKAVANERIRLQELEGMLATCIDAATAMESASKIVQLLRKAQVQAIQLRD